MAKDEKALFDFDNIFAKTNVFEVLEKNIEELEKRLVKFAKTLDKSFAKINPNDEGKVTKAVKSSNELEKAQKQLNKQREVTIKTRKKLADLTDKELIQREKEKIAARERVQIAKQMVIINSKSAGQIEKLRAKLSLVTLQWKKLTVEEIKSNKALDKTGRTAKDVVKQKLRLTTQLKKLEKQTGDTRRNVGNYSDSLSKLGKVAARVFVGRTIIDGLRSISSGVLNLIKENRDADASIGALGDSFDETGKALKEAAVSILRFFAPALTFISNTISGLIGLADTFSKAIFGVGLGSKKASEGVRDLQLEFNAEIEVLKRGNLSVEARKQLIEDINEKYKDYLPNLIDENATLEDITRAQNAANIAFEKKITLLASEEQFIDLTKRRLDALREEVLLRRQLATATATLGRVAGSNEKIARDAARIAQKGVDITLERIAANQLLIDQIAEEKALLDEVIKGEGISTADFLSNKKAETNAVKRNTKATKTNTVAQKDNTAQRIAAIQSLQDQLLKAEGQGIEDREKRSLALEDAKFAAEQTKRKANFEKFKGLIKAQETNLIAIFGENSKEVAQFRDLAAKELAVVEALNFKLSEEQLEASEQRKLDIIKKFDDLRIAQATKTVQKAQSLIKKQTKEDEQIILDSIKKVQKAVQDDENEQAKIRKKAIEGRKETSAQLLKDTQAIAKKVGEAIVETFKKQAEVASGLVASQAEAVETQRKRAEAGLQNTLKFEQETLAQREADKIRAQKKAENTAKILALINLVSAAAASGDANAVGTALVQFALLETLVAALDGFYEGTEDTGTVRNPLDSRGGRLTITHDNERIMSAKHNAPLLRLGMSNEDVRENALLGHMIKGRQLLNANHYRQQFNDFEKATHRTDKVVDNGRLEAEMRQVVLAIKNKPVQQDDLVKVTETAVIISRRVTTNMMTRKEKIKTYL